MGEETQGKGKEGYTMRQREKNTSRKTVEVNVVETLETKNYKQCLFLDSNMNKFNKLTFPSKGQNKNLLQKMIIFILQLAFMSIKQDLGQRMIQQSK